MNQETLEQQHGASLFNLFDQAEETIARNNRTIAILRAADPAFKELAGTQAAGLGDLLSLEQCLTVAKSLASALLHHKHMNRDSANIEEAEDMACGIVLNLAGEIRNLNSYKAHTGRCPCDSCAARAAMNSHDRKLDGMAS
jgi:hypothetical protein